MQIDTADATQLKAKATTLDKQEPNKKKTNWQPQIHFSGKPQQYKKGKKNTLQTEKR